VIREELFMPVSSDGRRRPTKLSAETKWEIFLQVTAGEMSQAEAARKWCVDVSTVIGIRRTVKDAALAALVRKPGRPGKQRDWQLEAARAEIAALTEAVKAQAIELAITRGKGSWG
jgi:transposase